MQSMTNANRASIGGLAKLGEGARTTNDSRVSAGLSRGANLGKKLNAAPWSDTFPAAGATLDLDFANNRGFVRGVGQGGVMDAITFTRASNGTYVNEQGLLVTHANQGALGNNLLQFPQDFDNSYWTKGNSSVVADVEIAPNGTKTADILIPNTVFQNHRINRTVTTTTTTTVSIYAKAAGYNFLQILCQTTGYANFNLANGTLGNSSLLTPSIEDAGNGWYRCIVTATDASPIEFLVLETDVSVRRESYTGDGESGIFIWGAQLEVGASPTEYFPTNIGQPRFDWASTEQVANKNLLSYTDTLTVLWNTSRVSYQSTTITDPDGGNTAIRLRGTNSNSLFSFTPIVASGGIDTYSVWLKVPSGTLTTRIQIGGLGTSNSITITDTWQKIVLTEDTSFGTSSGPIIGGSSTWGIGVDIDFWHPQYEVGDTATDYQPIAQPTSSTPLLANPTSNGLLIEQARTNRLFWNRDATQTEWVKTNVTAAKDQTGIDGVANAASSLTATANDGTCIQTITLAAGDRTGSVFLKRLTGTGNIQVTLDGSTYSTVELSDTLWYRIVLSGSVTNPTVGIKLAVSGDAVAMDYGQVEDGLFVTSPILTTTATVTRAVDTATIDETNVFSFYNNGFLTWNIQFKGITNSTGGSLISLAGQGTNFATTVNSFRILVSSGRAFQGILNNINGVGINTITNNNDYLQFADSKYIFSSNSSNCFSAFNNQSFTTGSVNNHGISTNLNRVRLFGSRDNTNTSGYIKRLTYVPKFITETAGQDWSTK
jgi:hypothetical protein